MDNNQGQNITKAINDLDEALCRHDKYIVELYCRSVAQDALIDVLLSLYPDRQLLAAKIQAEIDHGLNQLSSSQAPVDLFPYFSQILGAKLKHLCKQP